MLLAALLGAALAASGCAGGEEGATGTTLSGEEYSQRADDLCAHLAADVADLGAEQKGREILSGGGSDEEKMNRVADLLDDQLQILSDFREDVERLGRPATGADDVDRILEKTRSAEHELARAIDALRDEDEDGFLAAAQRYAELSQQSAEIARDSELDFAVCGAGA